MRQVSRRRFLDLAATATGLVLTGCLGDPLPPPKEAGTSGSGGAGAGGGPGQGSAGSGGAGGGGSGGQYPVAVTAYEDPALRAAAVRAAIELAGGMPWLKGGPC